MRKSTIKREYRVYADNYRWYLEPYEDQVIEVSSIIEKIKKHQTRKDLTNVLLVDLDLKPLNDDSFPASHIWILKKQLEHVGINVKIGERVSFFGTVYPYYRLGGRSKERDLYKYHDFGILPVI
ncbi:MAG: hypothetical protein R3321_13745 [Nitrososphaeraceae archaeon]|nr:hypothetical protein [Nitrososphaeraceae archaeon]